MRMKLNPLRQVATYTVPPNVSLRIFEEQSSTSSIPRLLIAEPLLDWQRDEQGRPLINAASKAQQGGGAVFELRLIINTVESQQAAQRAVSTNLSLQNMCLITQIDSVNLALSKGNMGESLEFCGGEMYPSRNGDVLVDFESPALTASEEDIEKVRSILRSVRLTCKASVNGHELPPISLDFSTIAPSSSSSRGAAAVNDVVPVADFRRPHSPRSVKLPFSSVYRLAWTRSGNLVATTGEPCFYILKPNGEIIRQIDSPYVSYEKKTFGVAVSDEGLIFVSDITANRITIYSEEGRLLRLFGFFGEAADKLSYPSDVAISKKTGNIFVADHRRRILVFNQEGKFLYLFDQTHLESPYGIDIDDDDAVYVAENLGHKISVFTSDGQFLRSFGSYGSAPGQFNGLHQLYIDRPSDRILVAEWGNRRIQIMNKFGAVEQVIQTGMPVMAVVTDKDGKLIVGGDDGLLFYDN